MKINLRGFLIGLGISICILALPVIYFYWLMPHDYFASCDKEGQKIVAEEVLERHWKTITRQEIIPGSFLPKCGTVDNPTDMGKSEGPIMWSCYACTGEVIEENGRNMCYGTAYMCSGI
ncbi:MAG: hypothetical protein WD335_00860 [Candidatus Paceibacterota bacterium]